MKKGINTNSKSDVEIFKMWRIEKDKEEVKWRN
jgi:hypothetical protein